VFFAGICYNHSGFMEIAFFLRSLVIGLSIAATIGPMSILCIQRTLQKGYLYGLVSGLGIATADGFYGSIAGFGLTIISTFLVSQQAWIRLTGGLFLVYLGVKTLLSRPAERAAIAKARTGTFLGAYSSTFLLTLTNPLTILSFTAIFAGLGLASNAGKNYLAAAPVVAGVFCGSALWWCILTAGISLLRGKFTPTWMLWLNRASGCIIAVFGIIALASLI
jgi:threonine/homoserine/homoserine lactone efflux protein